MSITVKNNKGFTIIELLIVVTIIGVLSAISIPGYIGIQERGRKGAVTKAVEQSASELQAWIHASRSIGPDTFATQLDTDGNGQVQVGLDATNGALAAEFAKANGLCVLYTSSKTGVSPWNPALALWKSGGPAAGQIDCSHAPNSSITLTSQDLAANMVHAKVVTSD